MTTHYEYNALFRISLHLLYHSPHLILSLLKDTSPISNRVNLNNTHTRDSILIRNLGADTIGCAEHNIHLSTWSESASTASWETSNLQITAVALSHVCLDVVRVKTGEEHGVHVLVRGDQLRGKSVLVCVGEGDWGGASGVWVLGWLDGERWEGLEWECWITCCEAGDELSGK